MTRKKMILVEDNEDNRLMISDIVQLDRVDAELEVFETAEQALEAIPQLHPILVLMDVALPGIDGLEAARRLKGDPLTRSIPVWAVSAHAMAGDEDHALLAGCDAYYTKPINSLEFGAHLRQLIRECDEQEAA